MNKKYRIAVTDPETGKPVKFQGLPYIVETDTFLLIAKAGDSEGAQTFAVAGDCQPGADPEGNLVDAVFVGLRQQLLPLPRPTRVHWVYRLCMSFRSIIAEAMKKGTAAELLRLLADELDEKEAEG